MIEMVLEKQCATLSLGIGSNETEEASESGEHDGSQTVEPTNESWRKVAIKSQERSGGS